MRSPLDHRVLDLRYCLLVATCITACGPTVPGELPTARTFSVGSATGDTGPGAHTDSDDTPRADTASDTAQDTADDSGSSSDADGDGYAVPEDCDDANPDVHPGAEEVCDNGLDDNCDALACRWTGEAVLLTGDRADSAGVAVAVGDVTGDGTADVLVGGPDAAGSARTGTVRVWPHATPSSTEDLSSRGFALGSDAVAQGAGRSIVIPGDLNGDGYTDLAVGTQHVPDAAPGRMTVLLGPIDASRTLSDPDAWVDYPPSLEFIVFTAPGPFLDGTSTLLAGTPTEDGGVARMLAGPWTDSVDLDNATVTWTAREGAAGRSLASPGDLDGDGLDEVLIGLPDLDRVAVFSAPWSDAVVDDADRWLESEDATFGTELASAGDVDGDGLPDVLVAVAVGEPDAGRVTLLCGAEATACAFFEGREAGEQLGHDLVETGDTEGDGFAEVALAAHGTADLGVWFGPVSGTHTLDSADERATFAGQAGFALAAGGTRLVVGAPTAGSTDPPSGGAFVIEFPGF